LDYKFFLKDIIPKNISLEVLNDDLIISTSDLKNLLTINEQGILTKSSTEKRVREFCLGRVAAKNSILNLKSINKNSEIEILRSSEHRPLWPEGIVGSISHCSKRIVAVTAKETDYYGLGADIITKQRIVNPKIIETLCSDDERLNILGQWKDDLNLLYLTVFSVKESLYKLFSSLEFRKMEWKDFNLTEIKLNKAQSHFKIKVKLDKKFFKKTNRQDLVFCSEFDVIVSNYDGYITSFVFYPK